MAIQNTRNVKKFNMPRKERKPPNSTLVTTKPKMKKEKLDLLFQLL